MAHIKTFMLFLNLNSSRYTYKKSQFTVDNRTCKNTSNEPLGLPTGRELFHCYFCWCRKTLLQSNNRNPGRNSSHPPSPYWKCKDNKCLGLKVKLVSWVNPNKVCDVRDDVDTAGVGGDMKVSALCDDVAWGERGGKDEAWDNCVDEVLDVTLTLEYI